MSPVELRQIRATSPTLAETMRACLLRAGLSKATGSSTFVLGNPKAWLGTAYHEVLEKIADVDLGQEPLDAAVERLWTQAIATQQQRAGAHALNHRFGSPEAWPGYHVARASVLLRAQDLSAGRDPSVAPAAKQAPAAGPVGGIREQEFIACGGRLLGRPDVIRASEVADYKSGAILEYDDATQSDVVKAAYFHQLRIYVYLVKQKLWWWPYKLLCPSFWGTASPTWSGQLDGAAVEGALADAPIAIYSGAARAVALDIQAGSEARRRAQIAPLNPSAQPAVATLTAGEQVRLVGLRARPDGILAPTQRTVLARIVDLPTVTLAIGEQA